MGSDPEGRLHPNSGHGRHTALVAALALALTWAACDGDGTDPTGPIDPGTDSPAALDLEAPASAVAGEPFSVRVRALDQDGDLATGWTGTVALSATDGDLDGDSVAVTDGMGEVLATLTGHAGHVTLTATRGAASDTARLVLLGTGDAVRIEIAPGAVLLPGDGETTTLTARAYDEQDAPVAATIAWQSSDPDVVAVSGDGTLTAGAAPGAAQITATASGVTSPPVLALVAEPAEPDAALVADSQVVAGPEAVDPPDAYGPGWRYRVTLRDVDDLIEGQMVIGTGETPLGGRVVAMSGAGDDRVVTLELVPLDQLFVALAIDETLSLHAAPVGIAPDAVGSYRLQRLPGGALRATPRHPGTRFSARDIQVAATGEDGDVEFSLGPFQCTASMDPSGFNIEAPEYTIQPSLGLGFAYGESLERLVLEGGVEATATMRPVFDAAVDGDVACSALVFTVTLPIGGPLALFLGGQVPLGVGLDLDASLSLGEIGLDLEASAGVDMEVGLVCPAGGDCAFARTFETSTDGRFEFLYPDGLNDLRVTLSGYGHAFAALAVGARFSRDLQLELLKATAGLEQALDLATVEGQVADPGYASAFQLMTRADIAPGSDLADALELLGVEADAVTFEFRDTIAHSPRGTLTASPGSVRPSSPELPGDTVTFTVELDPTTYLALYAVDSVSIFWTRVMEEGDTIFQPAPGDCAAIPASSGQTSFSCETDLPESRLGPQDFHAVVHSNLFGAPIPVGLEVAEDARTEVILQRDAAAEVYWDDFTTSARVAYGTCEDQNVMLRREVFTSFSDSVSTTHACADMTGVATARHTLEYGFDQTGSVQSITGSLTVRSRADSDHAYSDEATPQILSTAVGRDDIRMHVHEPVTVTLRATCHMDGGPDVYTGFHNQAAVAVYATGDYGEQTLSFNCHLTPGGFEESMTIGPGHMTVVANGHANAQAPTVLGTTQETSTILEYAVGIDP